MQQLQLQLRVSARHFSYVRDRKTDSSVDRFLTFSSCEVSATPLLYRAGLILSEYILYSVHDIWSLFYLLVSLTSHRCTRRRCFEPYTHLPSSNPPAEPNSTRCNYQSNPTISFRVNVFAGAENAMARRARGCPPS